MPFEDAYFEALRAMEEDGAPLREVLEFLKAGDELRQAFVDSERGKGASFKVYLPALAGEAQ